jgi:ribonuclease R
MPTVRGRISVHPRGFGFLVVDGPEGELSAFVTPPDLNPLLDGDLVSATLVPAGEGRFNASALALVERTRTQLFGTVTLRSRRPFLHVDRLVSNTDWPLEEGAALGPLAEGTYLVAELRGGKLVPLRRVAEGADLGLERCVVRHGIRADFPPAVVEAAAEAAARPHVAAGGARRDLREVPTVTIDAPVTTDIDDALSVFPAGPDGAVRVLVSIADVDAFVAEGSLLDVEARARGTSVYLAGRAVPLLPDTLSSAAASLVEGKDRPALTVELRIDP